jgi:hypothetical protein
MAILQTNASSVKFGSMNAVKELDELCKMIDTLIASGKIHRFPVEGDVVPYLTHAFDLSAQEAIEALFEWERRHGRR